MVHNTLTPMNVGTQFTNILSASNFFVAPSFQVITPGMTSLPYVSHDAFVAEPNPDISLKAAERGMLFEEDCLSFGEGLIKNHRFSGYQYKAAMTVEDGKEVSDAFRSYSHAQWEIWKDLSGSGRGDPKVVAGHALRSAWGVANAIETSGDPLAISSYADYMVLKNMASVVLAVVDKLQLSGLKAFLHNAGQMVDEVMSSGLQDETIRAVATFLGGQISSDKGDAPKLLDALTALKAVGEDAGPDEDWEGRYHLDLLKLSGEALEGATWERIDQVLGEAVSQGRTGAANIWDITDVCLAKGITIPHMALLYHYGDSLSETLIDNIKGWVIGNPWSSDHSLPYTFKYRVLIDQLDHDRKHNPESYRKTINDNKDWLKKNAFELYDLTNMFGVYDFEIMTTPWTSDLDNDVHFDHKARNNGASSVPVYMERLFTSLVIHLALAGQMDKDRAWEFLNGRIPLIGKEEIELLEANKDKLDLLGAANVSLHDIFTMSGAADTFFTLSQPADELAAKLRLSRLYRDREVDDHKIDYLFREYDVAYIEMASDEIIRTLANFLSSVIKNFDTQALRGEDDELGIEDMDVRMNQKRHAIIAVIASRLSQYLVQEREYVDSSLQGFDDLKRTHLEAIEHFKAILEESHAALTEAHEVLSEAG